MDVYIRYTIAVLAAEKMLLLACWLLLLLAGWLTCWLAGWLLLLLLVNFSCFELWWGWCRLPIRCWSGGVGMELEMMMMIVVVLLLVNFGCLQLTLMNKNSDDWRAAICSFVFIRRITIYCNYILVSLVFCST